MKIGTRTSGVQTEQRILLILLSIILVFTTFAAPARAVRSADAASSSILSYSDVADLVTNSPVIAKARIKGTKKVKVATASSGSDGKEYLLVQAKVDLLIRGDGGVSPEVSFLTLAPRDGARIRRGRIVVIYAQRGARPGEIRLVSSNALQPWTADIEATTRAITSELLEAEAPPAIIAVGDAFHVAGTVAGEGETQIFFKTATGAPVSVSVIHRPGEPPRWGVSLGEVVDETAAPPTPHTLLWYRLACGLPENLPVQATRGLRLPDAEAAQRDYRFVIESLGSCGRTL